MDDDRGALPAKEELERRKLALEVKQLGDPWWKKPAYIAAFFPSVLAVGTLLTGVFTGYFQNEYKLLEIRKTTAEEADKRLKADERKLHEDQQGLAQLRQKVQADRDTLAREQDTIKGGQAEIDRQKEQLEKARGELAASTKQVEEAKKTAAEQLAAAQEVARTAPLGSSLDIIANAKGEVFPFDDVVKAIIAYLRANPDKKNEEVIAGKVKQVPGMEPIANYMLYKASGDARYKGELIKNGLAAFESEGRQAPKFWNIFSSGDWTAQEAAEICAAFARSLGKVAQVERRSEVLDVCAHTNLRFSDAADQQFTDRDGYIAAVAHARDLARNRGLRYYHRVRPLEALGALAPAVFAIVAADLIASGEPQYEVLSQIKSSLQGAPQLRAALTALQVPQDTERAGWETWLRRQPVAGVKDAVLGKSLSELQAEPELITKLRQTLQNGS